MSNLILLLFIYIVIVAFANEERKSSLEKNFEQKRTSTIKEGEGDRERLEGRETPMLWNLREKYGERAARQVTQILEKHLLKVDGGVDCDRPVDILWVVDGSGSVTLPNYVFICEFVRDVASYFDFLSPEFPSGAQHGYVQFSEIARLEISLKAFTNATLFGEAVVANASSYYKDSTQTWLGIDLAQAELELNGRSSSVGGAHIIIVVTDGQSGDKAKTIASADAARDGLSTVACITIGDPSKFNPGETEGVVGYDNTLLYPIESWSGIEDNRVIVANITGRACSASITVEELENITSTIGCNSTIPVTYFPNLTQPVTLKAMISKGEVTLCHSYVIETPAPSVDDSVCNDVGVGTTHIVTTSAYPPPNATSNKPGKATLYVSVKSKPSLDDDQDCGGNFTLEIYYCSTRVALNLTNPPGQPVPYQTIGDPREPLCGECPAGLSFLSTDPMSILSTICSSRCDAAGQYIDISPITGVQTCFSCHPSCSTCVAKGGVRSCTSCPFGTFLLPNSVDPSLSSPYWDGFPNSVRDSEVIDSRGQQIVPTTQALNGETSGRCLSNCPGGYVGNQQLNHPGSFYCSGERKNFVTEEPIALMISFGLPLNAYPLTSSCTVQFGSSSLAGRLAGALSAALGVPPAAVFLRSCLDINANVRWIYTYGEIMSPVSINVTNASIAVNSVSKGLCNISTVATFAVILGISSPGEANDALKRAFAMTTLTTDLQLLNSRSQTFQTNLPAAVWNAPSQPIQLAINCTISGSLFSYAAPVLLNACAVAEDLNSIPSIFVLASRDSATYCLPPPPPSPNEPSNSQGRVALIATAVLVPALVFALLLLCCCGAYCSWRAKRLKTIAILQTRAKEREKANSDGLGTRERAASMSARLTQLGENPYLGNSGKRELLREKSAKMKTGFAPVALGATVVENPLAKTEEVITVEQEAINDVSETVEQTVHPDQQVDKNEAQEEQDQVVDNNSNQQQQQHQLEMNAVEPIHTLISEISEERVIVNPLASVEVVDKLAEVDAALDSIDLTRPEQSVSEWGSIQSASSLEKNVPIAPARGAIMSISQQLLELVIPGSVTLGMGIFSDQVADDKKLALVAEEPVDSTHASGSSGSSTSTTTLSTKPPVAQAPSATRKNDGLLNVGTIKIEREVVSTQTVRLKRVEKIKGDASFNAGSRSELNYSAVSGRTLVVEEKKVGAVKVRGV